MNIQLIRFWLRIALRGGRLFAPFAVALALLGLIHSGGSSPARSSYPSAAALLFPFQVWLAQQVVSSVPQETRRVILVAVGDRRRLLISVGCAALVPNAVLALLSFGWPLIIRAIPETGHPLTGYDVAFGLIASLSLLPAATALGVITSEVSVGERAQAAIAGALAVIATLLLGFGVLAPLAPPLVGLARLGGTTTPTAGHLGVVVAQSFGWAAVALALAARRLGRRW